MDSITIDGMDEHDFRHSIEDMLRLDNADRAIEKLRGLLEPYAGEGGILPARFLEVTPASVEFAGWQRLAARLGDYDRRGHPISAIGVVLADARVLGGPGPTGGWLAPFIKTYYFNDKAYPFSDATRDDLLDGYSREGFEWQDDYQATDATLSIKGIDDLYGAIVELEDRLFNCAQPGLDEVRAGSIGACYLAALIHLSLRETIRKKGLPRPLCVLAACEGVYPFFDAPVAGHDECVVGESDDAAPGETESDAAERGEVWPTEVWPDEPEGAAEGDEAEFAGDAPGAASLLDRASRKGTKTPVMVLGDADAREAAEFTELASAQRLTGDGEAEPKAPPRKALAAVSDDWDWPDADWPDDDRDGAEALCDGAEDEADPGASAIADEDGFAGDPSGQPEEAADADAGAGEALFAPPTRHSLRSRFDLAQPEANRAGRFGLRALAAWFSRAIFRR